MPYLFSQVLGFPKLFVYFEVINDEITYSISDREKKKHTQKFNRVVCDLSSNSKWEQIRKAIEWRWCPEKIDFRGSKPETYFTSCKLEKILGKDQNGEMTSGLFSLPQGEFILQEKKPMELLEQEFPETCKIVRISMIFNPAPPLYQQAPPCSPSCYFTLPSSLMIKSEPHSAQFKTRFGDALVTHSIWAITLITTENPSSFFEMGHLAILIEGVDEKLEYFAERYELRSTKDGLYTVGMRTMSGLEKVVAHSSIWLRPKCQVRKMITEIEKEFLTLQPYNPYGMWEPRSKLLSKLVLDKRVPSDHPAHNCTTWAIRKLEIVGIFLHYPSFNDSHLIKAAWPDIFTPYKVKPLPDNMLEILDRIDKLSEKENSNRIEISNDYYSLAECIADEGPLYPISSLKVQYLRAAMEYNDQKGDIYLSLGLLSRELNVKKYLFEMSIKHDPDNPEPFYQLGLLDSEKSIDHFKKSLDLTRKILQEEEEKSDKLKAEGTQSKENKILSKHYFRMALLYNYLISDKNSQAGMLLKAFELDPTNMNIYLELLHVAPNQITKEQAEIVEKLASVRDMTLSKQYFQLAKREFMNGSSKLLSKIASERIRVETRSRILREEIERNVENQRGLYEQIKLNVDDALRCYKLSKAIPPKMIHENIGTKKELLHKAISLCSKDKKLLSKCYTELAKYYGPSVVLPGERVSILRTDLLQKAIVLDQDNLDAHYYLASLQLNSLEKVRKLTEDALKQLKSQSEEKENCELNQIIAEHYYRLALMSDDLLIKESLLKHSLMADPENLDVYEEISKIKWKEIDLIQNQNPLFGALYYQLSQEISFGGSLDMGDGIVDRKDLLYEAIRHIAPLSEDSDRELLSHCYLELGKEVQNSYFRLPNQEVLNAGELFSKAVKYNPKNSEAVMYLKRSNALQKISPYPKARDPLTSPVDRSIKLSNAAVSFSFDPYTEDLDSDEE